MSNDPACCALQRTSRTCWVVSLIHISDISAQVEYPPEAKYVVNHHQGMRRIVGPDLRSAIAMLEVNQLTTYVLKSPTC